MYQKGSKNGRFIGGFFFISALDDSKKGVRTSAVLRNIRGYSDFCMKQPQIVNSFSKFKS